MDKLVDLLRVQFRPFSEGMTPWRVVSRRFAQFDFCSTIIAWRWETLGGKLLLYEGLLILAIFPAIAAGSISFGGILFVILTMALPPLLAGILLRINWQRL
jgi:hypothetical protein